MKVNNIQVGYNNRNSYSRQHTSFGGIRSALGNTNRIAMKFLEKGGFFAEFCLMDMCGLVIPRVYQGFQRNKKELGHLNYQAGMEEFLREVITGPSMFLIPIGAVILAGKLLGKGTQISFKLLPKFSEIFKGLGNKLVSKPVSEMQGGFANKLFDDLFVNNTRKIANSTSERTLESFREKFVSYLTSGITQKATAAESKSNMGKFVDLVADINAAHFKNEDSALLDFAATKGKAIKTTASDLYLDARKYMEDIIPSAKLTFDELKNVPKKLFDETIDKITQLRLNGRELLCVGGTATLAGFLSIIPKIYQLSKKNPALNGLEDNKNNSAKEAKPC